MRLNDDAHFSTICIHAGQEPDPTTGAIITPIYQTSTYVQEGLGQHKGYEYGRTQNPTRMALERNLAAIEAGVAASPSPRAWRPSTRSSPASSPATTCVVSDNTYGGTFRLFERVRRKFGLGFSYVDTSQLDLIEPAITPKTKYLFIETPTNPMLRITDLAAASEIAHRHGVRVVVDNTFASPYVQQPLLLGADIVTTARRSSSTATATASAASSCVKHEDDVEWMRFVQNAAGAILGPMDSFLVLRGTKTLDVRMERTNANGQAIAEFLAAHPKVTATIYPGPAVASAACAGRPPDARIRRADLVRYGSIDAARAVLARVRLMALAESLGGVETLISHPALMTHASVPPERRAAIGITDGLVRVSVGIEHLADLEADLAQALE